MVEFEDLRQISPMDKAYACHFEQLSSFFQYPPKLDQFSQIARDKSADKTNRTLLVEVLKDQYKQLHPGNSTLDEAIESLHSDDCFTITTAHQPSLLTGPLYFIYKACSTIALARKVSEETGLRIQPFFVLGGEDHDFAEINHCFWGDKKVEWVRSASGSVGRLSTKGLDRVLNQLDYLTLKHSDAIELAEKFRVFLEDSANYGEFTARIVHHLFGRYGMLVLNMDDRRLKEAMISRFEEEVLQGPSLELVQETQNALVEAGYSTQAYPRAINLFYLRDNLRERIELIDGKYQVLNTDIQFDSKEVRQEIAQYPYRFSPNVIFRPIYQEAILPNLAYVGGGGELAYWLERKSQFDHFGINFPMLVRRDSAIWLDGWSARKLQKWNLSIVDLSQRTDQLINEAVSSWSSARYSLSEEEQALQNVFESISQKAKAIDPSLLPMIESQGTFHQKKLQHLGGKLRKAEKAKYHQEISEITRLANTLFPGGKLQERRQNFLPIFASEGFSFIDKLLDQFNPLDPRLKIIS